MQQVFSSPLTYYSCCLLSLYQTQLFSLLPKQIESLITFHQPAQATTTDQYPPQLYLSFTTVEYTSHTQDKPSWVNLHTRPPTPHTETDSPICPPSYWFPADNSTAFWRWRRFAVSYSSLCMFNHSLRLSSWENWSMSRRENAICVLAKYHKSWLLNIGSEGGSSVML